MSLVFGTPIVSTKALPRLIRYRNKYSPFGWIKNFISFVVRIFVDIVVEKIIGSIINLVVPGGILINSIIKIGLGFVSEIIQDLIFDKQINWKSLIWRVGLRFLYVPVNYFKKFKTFNFAYKISKQVFNIATNPISSILNLSKKILFKNASKITFKNSLLWSKLPYIIKRKNKNLTKVLNNAIKVIRYAENPLRLLNDSAKWMLKKPKLLIIKAYENQFHKMVFQYGKNNQTLIKNNIKNNIKNKQYDFYDSAWIWGVRFFDTNFWEEERDKISFTIYFNFLTTNKKLPIVLVNQPFSKFINFVNASSKGKYYLDHFAWKWSIGKLIRQNKEFEYSSLEQMKNQLKNFNFKKMNFQIYDSKNSLKKIQNNIDDFHLLRKGRKYGNKFAHLQKVNSKYKLSFHKVSSTIKANKKTVGLISSVIKRNKRF